MWVLGLFIVIPLIEIALFIQIGGLLGLWPTLALIVGLALLGSWLVRTQGLKAFAELQASLQNGQDPSAALLHGVMIFFAGLLLMVPGFFTDAIGLALLIRPVRALAIRALAHRFGRLISVWPATRGRPRDSEVIDGTFTDVGPEAQAARRSGPPSGWTRH